MSVRSESITNIILEVLNGVGQLLPRPFETKHAWGNRLKNINKPQFERAVRHLKNSGMVKIVEIQNQKFIKITKSGQLEVLLKKAKTKITGPWDGKWRLIIFDIPEASKDKREFLRSLLKRQGFYKLQASVYINPYPFNREAIDYLNQTGLIDFIRILRIDDMDNDKQLIKYFGLK